MGKQEDGIEGLDKVSGWKWKLERPFTLLVKSYCSKFSHFQSSKPPNDSAVPKVYKISVKPESMECGNTKLRYAIYLASQTGLYFVFTEEFLMTYSVHTRLYIWYTVIHIIF